MKKDMVIECPGRYNIYYRSVLGLHHTQIILWYLRDIHDPQYLYRSEWSFFSRENCTAEDVLRERRVIV